MQTWSVGILCYNEAGSLEAVTVQLRDVLQKITNTFEIVIVDDCSTDGSADIAKELSNKFPEVKTVIHPVNKGIGGALRSIYDNTQYENIAFIPGDGQFDVAEYLPYAEVPQGHFVSYYRKENTSYSIFRNILSLFNKQLNNVFIGIDLRDVNWTKIYKKADIDQLDLQLTSSLIESEICAKLLFLGKKVIEVESKYLPRTYGQSKGSSMAIVKKALKDTGILIAIMRKFRASHRK
ncbi:MAG: glycosyltransferase family 2 protein [Bacteroidota bacterium]